MFHRLPKQRLATDVAPTVSPALALLGATPIPPANAPVVPASIAPVIIPFAGEVAHAASVAQSALATGVVGAAPAAHILTAHHNTNVVAAAALEDMNIQQGFAAELSQIQAQFIAAGTGNEMIINVLNIAIEAQNALIANIAALNIPHQRAQSNQAVLAFFPHPMPAGEESVGDHGNTNAIN